MPLPFILPALTSLVGTGINALAQTSTNNANIRFARETNRQQRQWALDDWERQNQYNSPAQQMLRFQQAGLNKNLIYGQTNEAQSVRSTNMETPKLDPIRLDTNALTQGVQDSLFNYQNYQSKEKQNELLDAQISLVEYEKNKKIADTNKTIAQTPGAEADSKVKSNTIDTAIATQQANLNRINASTNSLQGIESREKKMFANKMEIAKQQINNILSSTQLNRMQQAKVREEIGKVINEQSLQKTELMLRRMGISWNDELQYRLIATGIDKIMNAMK